MQREYASEIFRYIGKAPEPTPEEEEEIRKLLEEANADWE
ncbi:hypothetical protein MmiHf6_07750 [Methanimicrococcus hongohii]|uniref:Uncharacterized protein n=1 Tax=Methanimicrococcus hongohii TaxID=3028295 RepID=A0AA97A1Q7_9EURY|nr:hypothetical protein MmiHf6_07750 [Methanimicrococcus sp. Hf6]